MSRKLRTLAAAGVVALTLAAAPPAGAVPITADSLGSGVQTVDSSAFAEGLTVLSAGGLTISGGTNFPALFFPGTDLSYADTTYPLTLSFAPSTSGFLFDFVTAVGDSLTLTAYAADGAVLEQDSFALSGFPALAGFPSGEIGMAGLPGIDHVLLTDDFGPGGVFIGSVRFVVPEPGGLGLLGIGLLALGWRRRRRAAVLLAALVVPLAGVAAAAATPSTPTRPQLTDAEAQTQTILAYFAQFAPPSAVVPAAGNPPSGPPFVTFTTDNWDPTAGVGDITRFTPDYVVAQDGSGNFTTVQAAINAASAILGGNRKYIAVKPGSYREAVTVASNAPPITLYGLAPFPSQVVVVNNFANPESKPQTAPVTCGGASTYGTSGSATFTVKSNGFRARNLTFQNDYVRGTCPTNLYSNQSAVALNVTGDQAIFENVRVLGHQDSLALGSLSAVYRAYFLNSFIQGDTDFIFGAETAVFNHCTINYTTDSLGPNATGVGMNFAPSTIVPNTHGFLVINSSLTASANAPANGIYMARAWDQSVTTYFNGISPNGRLVVRDSTIGRHIFTAAPYAKSTVGRPYSWSESCRITLPATIDNCAPVTGQTLSPNLLFEYDNTVLQ